jgi:hypothetical protein
MEAPMEVFLSLSLRLIDLCHELVNLMSYLKINKYSELQDNRIDDKKK